MQLTDSSRPWYTPPAKLGSRQDSPATNPTRAVGPVPPTPRRQAHKLRFKREARANLKKGDPPLHLHTATAQTAIAWLRSYIQMMACLQSTLYVSSGGAGLRQASALVTSRALGATCAFYTLQI